jgi:hypothetical protein
VGRMAACRISDYLLDIGTPENYHAAQLSWPGFQLDPSEGEHATGCHLRYGWSDRR